MNSLSARRLVVPKPAPASSTAQTIWLLTQAQMDMGTVAQQQDNRKVDIRFIQDPQSVLRTDGCYCTRPRAELSRRLQHGEITGPATKCQLYVPKAPILPAQIREIFQQSPANMVAQTLQRTLYQQASQPYRHARLHQHEPRQNTAPMDTSLPGNPATGQWDAPTNLPLQRLPNGRIA